MLGYLLCEKPPKDAFYYGASLFHCEQTGLSVPVEASFHCPVIMPDWCNWVVIRKKQGGGFFFLTFESDILFSLGRSQCSIFVSKIHIGNAKSSHAGVRRGRCQEDPVALFRN